MEYIGPTLRTLICAGNILQNQPMNLNAYAAELRLRLLEELKSGSAPSLGKFDLAVLDEGRKKGAPQMGSTLYEPHAIVFEFLYSAPHVAATVLSVKVEAPERIVFMPVPEWVVESIWQGEIDGSFCFESDARELSEKYSHELEAAPNAKWFGRRTPKRRE